MVMNMPVFLFLCLQVLIVQANLENGRWLVRLANGKEVLVRAEHMEAWVSLSS